MSDNVDSTPKSGLGAVVEEWFPRVFGFMIAGGFFVIIALNDEQTGPPLRAHFEAWRWFYLITVFSIVGAIIFVWKYIRVSDTVRALLLTCVAVPLIILALYAIAFIDPKWQHAIIRTLFVMVAAALPAVMYYLFIATRRPSLFDEFLTNLRRLKLIPRAEEKDLGAAKAISKSELDSYLLKFEDNYGQIPASRRQEAIAEILNLKRTAAGEAYGTGDGSIGRRLMSFEATNLLSPRILLPLALSTILIGLGWLLVLPPLPAQELPAETTLGSFLLRENFGPVSFAFLGAYFFSLQMLFRRYVLRDLKPAAYLAVCQRIVLTVVFAWVAVVAYAEISSWSLPEVDTAGATAAARQTHTPNALLLIAFLIGIFPRILWELIILTLSKITFIDRYVRRIQPELPLSELDGLSIWHEARLEEEDIDSAPNMATANIVDLMLSTRFSSNRIIDWVDQAILYTALGPDVAARDKVTRRQKLRAHGIRTASGLIKAYEKTKKAGMTPEEPKRADSGDADLHEFLKILETGERSPLQTLIDTLRTNTNLALILAWQESGNGGERNAPSLRDVEGHGAVARRVG